MTTATLRSLYSRATRAFLRRDIALTHSLLQSAFDILQPPPSYPDSLIEYRRKWDILRITLETMVYFSPPSPQTELPDELKIILLESPRVLLKSMYLRSLALFAPSDGASTASSTYLPGQVLLTLVYSSIKLNCHDSGRYMTEEWLARRDPLTLPDSTSAGAQEGDTYEKVLESYCLHILPNLEEWDYACEFLQHETELPDVARQKLKVTFDSLHTQALAARKTPQPKHRQFTDFGQSTSSPARPASPTPSTSSSLSTTSTHTIKPTNVRGRRELNGLQSISSLSSASASTTSLASDTTATARGQPLSRKSQHANGHAEPHSQPNGSRRPPKPSSGTNRSSSSSSHPSSSSSSPWPSLPFVSHTKTAAFDPSNPSIYALVKTTLTSYFTLPKLSTFLVIFVLFPVISFLIRYGHKRRKLIAAGGGASVTPTTHGGVTPLRNSPRAGNAITNADLVRKRLQKIGAGGDGSALYRLWTEVVRMLVDTVKMAGSGLV